MIWRAMRVGGLGLDQAPPSFIPATTRRPEVRRARSAPWRRACLPRLQTLEGRTLLTTAPGYDYVLSGQRWPDPSRISYSIAPDGVAWDTGINTLHAAWDARFGDSADWQAEIARALAAWQAVANINIFPVSDGSFGFNEAGLEQSDPRFGDIRIAGYTFPGSSTTLAQTYYPPPDGATGAGDVEINTSQDFGIGEGYDLFSVLLHETGHALGLGHSQNSQTVMYPVYQGVRSGLTAGDIAGIQAIYGARELDRFQSEGMGFNERTAINLTSLWEDSAPITISNVSVSYGESAEYYALEVPSTVSGSLEVTVSAAKLSMFSPQLVLKDGTGTVIVKEGDPAAWSNTVTVVTENLVAGRTYFLKVSGASREGFGVGAYQMTLSWQDLSGGGLPPEAAAPTTVPPTEPPPPTPDQSPTVTPDAFEFNDTPAAASWLGKVSTLSIAGLNLATGSDVDFFRFQTGVNGMLQIAASGVTIQVFNPRGRIVAQGVDAVRIRAVRPRSAFLVRIQSTWGTAVSGYTLTIGRPGPQPAFRRRIRP